MDFSVEEVRDQLDCPWELDAVVDVVEAKQTTRRKVMARVLQKQQQLRLIKMAERSVAV